MYILVNEGDCFQEGDEYYLGDWHSINPKWIGQVVSYKEDNSFSRHSVPVRRKTSEQGDGAAQTPNSARDAMQRIIEARRLAGTRSMVFMREVDSIIETFRAAE